MTTTRWTHYVRGVSLPNAPWYPEKNINDAIDYIPRDGDIIICSYMKTGSTWLQFILQQILSKGQPLPKFMDLFYKMMPSIEMAGIEAVEAMSEPRMYKHHFSQDVIPVRDNAKYLYIYRNPVDVLISYYHFYSDIVTEELAMDEFIDDYLKGVMWYGDYCDHVLSFLPQAKRQNVFLCTYENLISNRKEEVLRLAKFLGEEHYECLKKDEIILDKIVKQTEFNFMKKNLVMMLPEMPKDEKSSACPERKVNYFRKGTVGDGKKSLTETQLKKVLEHVAAKVKDTQLAREWLSSEQN